jgi:hypothetical protein
MHQSCPENRASDTLQSFGLAVAGSALRVGVTPSIIPFEVKTEFPPAELFHFFFAPPKGWPLWSAARSAALGRWRRSRPSAQILAKAMLRPALPIFISTNCAGARIACAAARGCVQLMDRAAQVAGDLRSLSFALRSRLCICAAYLSACAACRAFAQLIDPVAQLVCQPAQSVCKRFGQSHGAVFTSAGSFSGPCLLDLSSALSDEDQATWDCGAKMRMVPYDIAYMRDRLGFPASAQIGL